MSDSPHRVVVLGAKIAELTGVLAKYHDEHGLAPMSFDEEQWDEHRYPIDIEEVRSELIDATEELQELVHPPGKLLRLKLRPITNLFDIIYTFDLATHVPPIGRISYPDLANLAGMKESTLRRVVRYATSHHIFAEKEAGFVSHTAASRLLHEESAVRDWMGGNLQVAQPALLQHAAAIQKWPDADGPSQTAFALSDRTGSGSLWNFFAANPSAAKMFASAMTIMAKPGGALSLQHVTDNFPWASVGPGGGPGGTVVDIGGSSGDLGFALAEKFPHLNIIVEDLPATIATGEPRIGVNVKFIAHDYYDPQPVLGADVYMFRWCFHDIGDREGIRALRALIPALKPGSRILLVDAVMASPGSALNSEERWVRSTDLMMSVLFNSREREVEEWEQLFAAADDRFVWKGITRPKGSRLSLIECVWERDREE